MPVFNERQTVAEVVHRVSHNPQVKEIIVVDDASSDGTWEVLGGLAESDGRIKLFRHELNQGKGAALRTGFNAVSADIAIIQDADLEYDPAEYPLLIKPIVDGKADVVYGSRFLGSGPSRVLYFRHFLGNKLITLISNVFTNLNMTDIETCYKVFHRSVIERISIEENRFGVEPELTAKIARLGCRVYEVGISYSGRTYQEGKKINWKDGVWALWCIFKYNLRKKRP